MWTSILTVVGLGLIGSAASLRVLSLGGDWIVTNSNGSISLEAHVPGGIYSDLINGGVIKDYIFYEKNDLKYRWVGRENWTYSTTFNLSKKDLKFSKVNLVFHGLDTVADIWLNDERVGTSSNMFVRTVLNVKANVKEGSNSLAIKFTSPIQAGKQLASTVGYKIPPECPPDLYNGECHVNQLRKMQASFAWDWGPAFPSVGIWKEVNLELTNSNKLREVGFKTYDLDTNLDNYIVEVTSWFDEPNANGHLSVVFPFNPPTPQPANFSGEISVTNGEYKVNLTLPKNSVNLWWPRGYGNQTLYMLRVEFTPSGPYATLQHKSVEVGIRTVEMIQTPIVYGQEDKGLNFYLAVNKVPVFVKGSNWIPMNVLPEVGSNNPNRLSHLIYSAIEANFNSFRVWGGGVYESDLFYKYCDRKGILVWQDLMFACAMYPTTKPFLDSVKTEVTQQVQRLHHHPSVFAYGGNNENEAALVQNWYGTDRNFALYSKDYLKLYVDTIKPIVETLDSSRPYFTSSPSNGKETAKEGYIAKQPQSSLFGDAHFYIYMADMWDPMIYPVPRFASEYGMQSLPSIHTLAGAVSSKQLSWYSDVMQWRQHSPGGYGFIEAQVKMNLPWSDNLADIVYLSQINQAMAMKTETEHYRRYKTIADDAYQGRTMGALYWQLNDVWEAPSWSSIDFHGNWKMLHYFAKNFFSDLLVVPEKKLEDLEVYIVSDANILFYPQPDTLSVTTNLHSWDSFEPISTKTDQVTMTPGGSMLVYTSDITTVSNLTKADYFFTFELEGSPDNFLFPTSLKKANYPDATVKITKTEILHDRPDTARIYLETNANALFVWLESPYQNWMTSFSENGFHMFSPKKTVTVTMLGQIDTAILKTITVRNLKKTY